MPKDVLILPTNTTIANVNAMVKKVPVWANQNITLKANFNEFAFYPKNLGAKVLWLEMRKNFKYKPDPQGVEYVRSPAQSWQDRFKGIDCEDYAIFISCVLYNNQIPHSLRIVDYGDGWEHIYVVMAGKYIIDPVNPRFNKEFKEVIKYKDFKVL